MLTKKTNLILLFMLLPLLSLAQTVTTFNYTGAAQTYTVPAGVTSILVDVYGAQGGGATGGKGAQVNGIISVSPGEVLHVYVGGAGDFGNSRPGGFNGGGKGGGQMACGSGGGASDIRRNIFPYGLNQRVVIAGGGGGRGGLYSGGYGGYNGGDGGGSNNGKGGTQSAGGISGGGIGATDGSLGQGGQGGFDFRSTESGGGGGGGYWGGGGGKATSKAGGGGGSSLVPAGATCADNIRLGHGLIVITPVCELTLLPPSQTNVTCFGGSNGAATVSAIGGVNYSYQWSPGNPAGQGTASVTGLTAGAWSCTITDAGGCSVTQNFTITVNDATPPTALCQNITAFADGSGNASIIEADIDGGSMDNCGAVTISASKTAFTCADKGANNVTLTVTDGNSNTATCVAVVTVVDTTSPVSSCQNITAFLDGLGNATISASDLDNLSTDNCGGVTFIASQTVFTCANIGANNVTLTVTDGSSNTANCTAEVTILDTVSPTIACPGNQTENVDASCQFTLPDYTGLAAVSDNCVAATVTQSPVAGTVISGTTSILLTATDGSGNASTCTFDVTLNDATPPTVVCQNITAFIDDFGNAAINAADLDGGSADNCGAVSFSAAQTAFTCANLGSNNITLTVTDGNSNTATCTSIVTIADTTSPVIICPGNQTENVGASCQFTLVDYTGIVITSDNCGGSPTITQSPIAGTVISGTTAITMTAVDGNGNISTCTFDVVLNDAIAPTAVCQNITAFIDNFGNASITAADVDGGSTDNCGAVSFSAAQTAFTCANLGSNNITLTVTDGNSNSATCTSIVTIADTTSPVITCPGNQTENVGASCQFTLVDYTGLVIASDNCGGSPTITQSPIAGTVISGTTTITMTAVDGNGNISTCTFDVVLNDAVAPSAVCQNITTYLDGAGTSTIAAADLDGGSTDNCSGITFSASQTVFTCVDLGPNNVTLTVTDGNSNTATCLSTVTVVDTVSPVASCQNITVFLDGAGTASIVAADIDNGSTDNCSTVTLAASTTAFTCVDLGPNAVTLTVTDGSGNTSTCTSIVTVVDTVSPTASCQNITIFLDGAGNALIVAADIDNGSTDNCSTVTLAASTTSFTCADLGTNSVTLTVTDGSGNTSTCTSIVTVADTISPAASCQNITAFLDGSGNATIVAADIDNGSTDNCSTVILAASTTAFTCADLGPNAVTLTVTDGSGNTSTCTSTVTIADTVSPAVTCAGNQTENPDASCNFVLPDYTGLASATDNCGGSPSITQSPAVGTVISGQTTITITADDGNGNTSNCTFDVIFDDIIAPTITCPSNQNVDFSALCDYTLIDFTGLATATDNCSGVVITQSPAIGTVITTTTAVTLTATDGAGNSANCAFDVIPADNTVPTITCPADQNELVDGNCEYIIPDYTTMVATADNCSSTITLTQSLLAGTVVGVSTQTITITADDGNGNAADCSFTLNVTDNIAPTITCPADQADSYDDNCAFALLDYTGMATIADNCGIPTITQSPVAGTLVASNTVITLTVDDGNGNTANCSFNLTLSDTTAPVVVCPSDESIYLDGNCEVVLPDYTSSGNIYDNCDNNLTITQTPNAGKVYSATEEVEVTLVATDASGNVDSCSFYVSVEADENSGCIDNVVVSDLISPNGDGKNDFWIIHETSYIIGCTVYVYNRWGQKVFEAENYDNTWGGTSQSGEKLPDGAYYYVIECDGELKYKGDISILSLKK